MNNERRALPINRILNRENGRRLVIGGIMLLVIGLIFLVGYPQLTSYRVIGIIGTIEFFIGFVMYQTYDNPK